MAALRHHRTVDSGDERPQDARAPDQSLHRPLRRLCYAGFAPPDGAAFNARFVGRRVRATDGSGYLDFVSSGRFSESDDAGMYEGGYTYKNQGPNSGTLVFDYEDGEKCTALAAFDSFIAGTTLSVCEDGGVTRAAADPELGARGHRSGRHGSWRIRRRSTRSSPRSGWRTMTRQWLGGVAFVFVSPGEFSHGTGASERTGTYAYENTGRSSGTVELTYAGGGMCTLEPRVRGGRLGPHGLHLRRRVEPHDGRLDKLASRVRRRGRPRSRGPGRVLRTLPRQAPGVDR